MSEGQDNFSITIPVSAEMIRDVAATAVARAFSKGSESWRNDQGAGYRLISAEVQEAIKALDLAPIIQRALDEVLAPTVAEVMAELIRVEVKKQVKTIKASNEL